MNTTRRRPGSGRRDQATFPTGLASAASARRFVAETLASWGVDGMDAALLTSELATNAILHARTDFTVSLELGEHGIRVEVLDENTRLPFQPLVPVDATSGRGLFLVQALARSWGVETREEGKVVWFEVPAAV